MSAPYIGYGNDTLQRLPIAKTGDLLVCPSCGKQHALEGEPTGLILHFRCGEVTMLGAVNGRLVVGVKPDVAGQV